VRDFIAERVSDRPINKNILTVTTETRNLRKKGESMKGYGKRILVVDDEEHIRVLLCLLLEQDGYSVHTANGGEGAIHEMMLRRFDVILTDFDMPKTNGLDVISFGRTICPDVPILLMSAVPEMEDVARERGAYACIPKLFDKRDLLDLLHGAVQRLGAERSGVRLEGGMRAGERC
jgi:CheY-like chemotaxis protein